jgi:ankyrin
MKDFLIPAFALGFGTLFGAVASAETMTEVVSTGDPKLVSAALAKGVVPNELYAGTTGLHLAAEWGYREIAELLLKNGAKVDVIDRHRKTPLLWAAANGHEEVARLLLAAGADANWHDPDGNSVLSEAVQSKLVGLVKYLLGTGGVKLSADDVKPLRAAIDAQDAEIVRLLLERGANPCSKPEKDIGPFYAAAIYGTLEVMKILAEYASECSDRAILFDGFAAAAEKGRLPVVEYLFSQKPPREKVMSALKETFEDRQPEVAKFLIESASDLTPEDTGAFVADALQKQEPSLFQCLIDHGAALDIPNANGRTPLIQSCLDGDFEKAKFFVERNAAVEASDSWGVTPLLAASRTGNVRIVELLLNHGASLGAIDDQKHGPFLNAAMKGQADVCAALAAHGCDVNVIDPATGFTALHHAAANDDLAVARVLVSLGAKRSLTDLEGRTARDLAEERGAIEIADLLSPSSVKNAKSKRPR